MNPIKIPELFTALKTSSEIAPTKAYESMQYHAREFQLQIPDIESLQSEIPKLSDCVVIALGASFHPMGILSCAPLITREESTTVANISKEIQKRIRTAFKRSRENSSIAQSLRDITEPDF